MATPIPTWGGGGGTLPNANFSGKPVLALAHLQPCQGSSPTYRTIINNYKNIDAFVSVQSCIIGNLVVINRSNPEHSTLGPA